MMNKSMISKEDNKIILREVAIHKEMDHPNIAGMYETFSDPKKAYISMEYCEGGDLRELIKKEKQFCESDAALIITQVFQALAYIH